MTTADLLREELKPCPFCGGKAERKDIETDDGFSNQGGSTIECTACYASSAVVFGRKENLIGRWNTRAAADRAPEGRDAVLEEAALAVERRQGDFSSKSKYALGRLDAARICRALKSSAKETG